MEVVVVSGLPQGKSRHRSSALLAGALLVSTVACGSSPAETTGEASEPSAGSPLRDACGSELVLQTDWFPEPEHGGGYQLIGPTGRIDGSRGTYTGEIGATGVQLEIRAGGPYIGNQPVTSLLYQDASISLGYVYTDEAIKYSGELPTIAIFAPLQKSPQALMWDPSKYEFETLRDIGRSRAKVLYFEGAAFIDYLVGEGVIRRDQLDPSYDGSPSRFVVGGGDYIQEAYATNEPYRYEHDIPEWGKPIDFLLVSSGDYQPYAQAVSVTPQTLRGKRACLAALVPMMQQAQVDYMVNPGPVNETLLRLVEELRSSWSLTPGSVEDSVQRMRDSDIVANSPDGALGSFDMVRLGRYVPAMRQIYNSHGVETMKSDIAPEDIASNEFIDPRIHLP